MRFRMSWLFAPLFLAVLGFFARDRATLFQASWAAELERGVRLIEPGDEMSPATVFPDLPAGLSPRPDAPPLDKIKVSTAGGDASALSALAPRAAPFEIVAAGANPDLVWNAASRSASAGAQILAYDVTALDLPAIVDRVAAARALAKLAAAKPQPIRLAAGEAIAHKGQKIEIEIQGVKGRALVVFDLSGDGRVELLYPLGLDDRMIKTPTFAWTFQAKEPFGADLIVAVTSAQPIDILEQGLRQLSHFQSAGLAPKLLAAAAPPDARVGLLTITSAP